MVKTIDGNENYQCKVVKIKEYKKHPNADKLFIVTIDFNNVITGIEPTIGQLCVYFPVLSKINSEFLSSINGFSDNELNSDKDIKGFFTSKCRVKPIKLRGLPSEGYLHPLEDVNNFLGSNLKEGDEFNSYNNIIFCDKYVIKSKESKSFTKTKSPKISRLIDGQFIFHNDTSNLRKNIFNINPNDLIEISYKKHGTSLVVGNILTKRKLSFLERIGKKLGLSIKESEYAVIYSSRRVVKNEEETKNTQGYYNTDIWGLAKDTLKDKIPKGYTLYCEILGFLPDGGDIQKGYDYGCCIGSFKVYVYKITNTNQDGFIINLTPLQISQFCDKYNLNYSDTLMYYGYAKDLFNIDTNLHWHENFLRKLEEAYTEKNCYMCTKKVPEEGIVLVKENLFNYEAYKLKSFKFLEYEEKELEAENINLEDDN